MITHLLPPGLTGLMAAALLAALMSTVSGALNSIATLFTYDLYKRWRPDTPDRKLVVIGRIATFVAMVLAIVWSPFISRWESIFQGCVAVICYLAPPITTVFLWGVLWKRASSKAAITTLVVGSFLGFVVFFLDFFSEAEWLSRYIRWRVPSMMATFCLFVICSVVLVLVSARYPHQHTAQSEKLVWNSPLEAMRDSAWRGIGNYKFLAVLLFIVMILLYFIFSTETTERWLGLLR